MFYLKMGMPHLLPIYGYHQRKHWRKEGIGNMLQSLQKNFYTTAAPAKVSVTRRQTVALECVIWFGLIGVFCVLQYWRNRYLGRFSRGKQERENDCRTWWSIWTSLSSDSVSLSSSLSFLSWQTWISRENDQRGRVPVIFTRKRLKKSKNPNIFD